MGLRTLDVCMYVCMMYVCVAHHITSDTSVCMTSEIYLPSQATSFRGSRMPPPRVTTFHRGSTSTGGISYEPAPSFLHVYWLGLSNDRVHIYTSLPTCYVVVLCPDDVRRLYRTYPKVQSTYHEYASICPQVYVCMLY